MTASTTPTIVLVHGAFADASGFAHTAFIAQPVTVADFIADALRNTT